MKTRGKIWILLVLLIVAGAFSLHKSNKKRNTQKIYRYSNPVIGKIEKTVSTTGTVNPQNRLEIKPSISGRIEQILVKEGQTVKKGDVLALMSSTERAALLDTALLQGEEEVSYWEEVYKTTPLIAPIDGVVIVRSVEPGQTVTTNEAVIVISDRLIIQADVDETDIGAVQIGQKSIIGLDAYPDIKINAVVNHISYESELINNVNIYSVDVVPERVPGVFRSGMSANVEIITLKKEDVLVIPIEAVKERNGRKFVMIKDEGLKENQPIPLQLGIQDENYYEVVSGITEQDTILVSASKSFSMKKQKNNWNPFMPISMQGKKGLNP